MKTYSELVNAEIPDLWHIAMGMGGYHTPEGKAVLATWHLAYDLQRALRIAPSVNPQRPAEG